MKGKWSGSKLPRMSFADRHSADKGSDYQPKVEAAKDRLGLRGRPSADLVADYRKLRAIKEDREKALYQAQVELTAAEQCLEDAFEREKITSVKTTDGASLGLSTKPHVVIRDKAALRRWMAANGHGELLDTLVPAWGTVGSWASALLEDGLEPPDGCDVFLKPTFSLRGAK